MPGLPLPFRATVTALTPDGVGTLTHTNGTTLRFGATARRGYRTLSICSAAAIERRVCVGSLLLQQAGVVSSGAVLVVGALDGGAPASGLALASRLVIHETEA
jgi:hypothetical protein